MEDLFQLQKRPIDEYLQDALNEPSTLGSVKETEEEYSGKEGRLIYSLHDLSRDLKKLSCRSDLFENKQVSLPRMASVVQRDGDSSIRESDLEYDESSEDEKRSNKSTPYFGPDSARMMLIDNMEPCEELIKKAGQGKRKRKMEKLPDTIQEENCESEFPPETNPIGTLSSSL